MLDRVICDEDIQATFRTRNRLTRWLLSLCIMLVLRDLMTVFDLLSRIGFQCDGHKGYTVLLNYRSSGI